jgi:lipoprotein-anchoring transpeptidase ErfK/SrfK
MTFPFDRVAPAAVLLLATSAFAASPAAARPLGYASAQSTATIFNEVVRDGSIVDESQDDGDVPPALRRQVVAYGTKEAPGTVIIDTPHTYLYYVLGGGKAIRYGIGVGREGFTWSGVKEIARKAEWPDWYPPSEMLARQPYLPRMMAGGPGNPLGARAMYLGGTIYRIHGTNAPATIGGRVSSGCIRMLNEDVVDLYNRVHVGTKVVVLPMTQHAPAVARARANPAAPSVATSTGSRALALY